MNSKTGDIYLVKWFAHLTEIHSLLWIYLAAISLITFCLYGFDKYQARHNRRRIPEILLHMLALLGGTIGALVGQHFFHHKTKKLKFRLMFIIIVIVQAGLISWWTVNKSKTL